MFSRFSFFANLRIPLRVSLSMKSMDAAAAMELDSLPDDPSTLKAMIRELLATLHRRDHELEGVRHRLDQLLRRLYGRKSEKLDPNQLFLFALDDVTAEPTPDPPAASETPNKGKRGQARRRLPSEDLPRRREIHDLPESEKVCPCCNEPLEKIGEETSEQLDYVPASAIVVEHVRYKYACKQCEDHIVRATKPAQPIEKGLCGPGLLAHIVTGKYADHLPLYRQESILARLGLEISRQTMCDWMAAAAELLNPIYRRMIDVIKQSAVVHTDDTPLPVQDPKLDQTRTGRIWVYLGDSVRRLTVFEYTPTRKRDGPAEFLKGYEGYLSADAYGGYDGIYLDSKGTIVELVCWAHARRKFVEATKTDAARAHAAVGMIAQLYAVEKQAKEEIAQYVKDLGEQAGPLPDLRGRLRQEQSQPILASMHAWLIEQQKTALPKSPIGIAIGYSLSNWEALVRYTEHGGLPIDNNPAEQAIKNFVIGRKNWLFAGSDKGGQTAAILTSLTVSCKRNKIDPFAYLRDILDRISTHPANDIDSLLPHRWQPAD